MSNEIYYAPDIIPIFTDAKKKVMVYSPLVIYGPYLIILHHSRDIPGI
jgi:hypothetical protein